jgi:hypothetical protein
LPKKQSQFGLPNHENRNKPKILHSRFLTLAKSGWRRRTKSFKCQSPTLDSEYLLKVGKQHTIRLEIH